MRHEDLDRQDARVPRVGVGERDVDAKGCDLYWLKVALDYCAPGKVVSTEGESYFSWSCELPGWGRFGADMLDYVVMYRDEDVS
jgi:hypothetical protein